MGLEATCVARFGGKSSSGKARLEQKDLQFRGDFRLDIPLDSITRAEAKRGTLGVRFGGGVAEFDLGAQAEKWALKIRYPKPLIDKLGVKTGMRVVLAGKHDGVGDASFWRDLTSRVEIREGLLPRSRGGAGRKQAKDENKDKKAKAATVKDKPEMILFFAAEAAELKALSALEKQIKRDGAIWAIYPKGQKVIRESDVMAAAKAAGLVDIKNASFSETHSALKLVIPVAKR